ncbi:TIGR04255 family protein [Burkholderia pseudomallei]|uniref:TIGR04255 family protein n=2 Tax=Burkholderia pseudomallei TaxID=28450 RepID=UPI001EFACE7E|nr:TIGR04255 family protein [Burkholderia pseudomallei]MCW0031205.1 TIGR04255 family protein [Burkholderia pseudomallei]MCW0053823.1 TIGR04255 family protein [Burkholderia pseudomallei]MCW0092081.1 TIGR04255 family protein [Burkholderia pseudomallei]MCW0107338.1 TIGR04255 family protein [Burkholderia pseudomallei]MCW0117226.1 TIGR04255 family protein [Burkholderia pseudomallei]
MAELDSREPIEFQGALSSSRYPNRSAEQPWAISFQTTGPVQMPPIPTPPSMLYHCSADDGTWRITLCSDFLSLTTTRYECWEDYLPRMLEAVTVLAKHYPNVAPKRLGLRYKDVIERESLDLAGTPWHELVRPFLLGPFAPGVLSDGFVPSECETRNLLLQSILSLDDCMLLLQSSLLQSVDGQRHAFLIDADFFTEDAVCSEMLNQTSALQDTLDKLHNNAGALFRRCITGRLHDALGPQPNK